MPYERLRFFKRSEFRVWAEHMHPTVLTALDDFRRRWGAPVLISLAPGALGRRMGPHAKSMHNVDRWGFVYAVDCFPVGMTTPLTRRDAVLDAIRSGFTGIGVYPDWSGGGQSGGLHLDCRGVAQGWPRSRRPSMWAGWRTASGQTYGPIDAAVRGGLSSDELWGRARV